MNIVVSGASGLIGTELVAALQNDGHNVTKLVRRAAGPGEVFWNPDTDTIDADAFAAVAPDAVVHLAGAGIGDKRWSASYKKQILDSRVNGTRLLARTIASMANKPRVFLSGSAIGFYGPQGDQVLDENSAVGSGFLAEVCKEWEDSAPCGN